MTAAVIYMKNTRRPQFSSPKAWAYMMSRCTRLSVCRDNFAIHSLSVENGNVTLR